MPSEVSTKRKIIGNTEIAAGTLVTTAGVTTALVAAATMTGVSLIPIAAGLIGGGALLAAKGIATANYGKKEGFLHKLFISNTIPTIRVPKTNVTPSYVRLANNLENLPQATCTTNDRSEEEYLHDLSTATHRIPTLSMPERAAKTNVTPSYIGATNDLEN